MGVLVHLTMSRIVASDANALEIGNDRYLVQIDVDESVGQIECRPKFGPAIFKPINLFVINYEIAVIM
jgi:hypothetical protein